METDEKRFDNITSFFPITSQSTLADRTFLINSLRLLKGEVGQFHYIELGSYLGGSLAPFLMDEDCVHILSIDQRGREQPDERGALFDYTQVTSADMIRNLREHGLDTSKLQVFDESIDQLPRQSLKYDLAFIDAEHTDWAAFRDFIYVFDLMNTDCVIMFHDSSVVSKALRLIPTMLDKNGGHFSTPKQIPYRFLKGSESNMSAFFFGKFARLDLDAHFGKSDTDSAFFSDSEARVLSMNIKHRVKYHVQPNTGSRIVNAVLRRILRRIPWTAEYEVKPVQVAWSAPATPPGEHESGKIREETTPRPLPPREG